MSTANGPPTHCLETIPCHANTPYCNSCPNKLPVPFIARARSPAIDSDDDADDNAFIREFFPPPKDDTQTETRREYIFYLLGLPFFRCVRSTQRSNTRLDGDSDSDSDGDAKEEQEEEEGDDDDGDENTEEDKDSAEEDTETEHESDAESNDKPHSCRRCTDDVGQWDYQTEAELKEGCPTRCVFTDRSTDPVAATLANE